MVVEESTGQPVFSRLANERLAIASTTKMMTALLTVERVALTDIFEVADYSAGAAESVAKLKRGEPVSVADLLKATMLASANDAAVTLADGVGGAVDTFVVAMNQRAAEMKLKNTHFSTPVGLDAPGNYSSAVDLAKIAIALRKNAFLKQTVDLPSAVIKVGKKKQTVVNRNNLVGSTPFVDGVKTGHTLDAGYVLVGSGTKHGRTFISVVLGEPSEAARDIDTLALLRYGVDNFTVRNPVRKGKVMASIVVKYRDWTLPLVAASGIRQVAAKSAVYKIKINAPKEVNGPIAKGTRVGTAVIFKDGKRIARIPLLAAREVPGASFPLRFWTSFGKPVPILLFLLAIAGIVFVLVRRRRSS